MARAREVEGIRPEARFRHAAAAALEVRAEEVFEWRVAVLDTSDTERVHDMRVATRRLRAVMEVFAPCFPKRRHRKALKEVKSIADVLGERRDPDVAIEALEKVAADLSAGDRGGIEGLVEELRAEQARANARLADAIADLDESGLRERLQELATAARHG
ncbi:MAG: CHAD domain-containing protein [Solirubrobacteraceae bacterium]